MSDNKTELELLTEIAKLLRKYGPETFDKLAQLITSPEFSDKLASILASTARASRSIKLMPREQPTRPRDFRSSLVALAETDTAKSEVLLKLYDGLMAKSLLPSLREMQAFAADAGFPAIKATGRDKAIIPFVKLFRGLSTDEIHTILSRIKPTETSQDRSLEGWSKVILDRERRTKQGG